MSYDSSMQILVVDDFPVMRRVTTNCLKQLGLPNFEEAANGHEALDKLKESHFDLVITDWEMPQMDGLQLLKAIRATEGIHTTPVLMVTAEGAQENIIAAIRSGVNNYVVKPLDVEKLKSKLDKIFAGP